LGRTRALIVSEFPTAASAALAHALGEPLAIEALRRPDRPDRAAARGLRARYAEDDGILRRAGALAAHAKSKASPIRTLLTSPAERRALWEVAAVARRVRRAGVTEVHADAGARERAALIAALAGAELRA
ncbi:MAG TPA: hypothetical protein VF517_03020, partial [Thermoleophilaceae bacterium]